MALEWLELGISYLTPGTWSGFRVPSYRRWLWWDPQSLLRWPVTALSYSIVDDFLWSFVTAFESVVLVSMLCFFFLFCGCNI